MLAHSVDHTLQGIRPMPSCKLHLLGKDEHIRKNINKHPKIYNLLLYCVLVCISQRNRDQ